jgi:hypothetical protein
MLDGEYEGQDWVMKMREGGRGVVASLTAQVTAARRELRTLEKFARAVVPVDGADDVFGRIYDKKLAERKEALLVAERAEAAGQITMELINNLKPGADFMKSWEAIRSGGIGSPLHIRFREEIISAYDLKPRRGGLFDT